MKSREPLLFSRYRRRHLANPFYPKQIRRRPWKRILVTIFLVFILSAGFVFASPFFVIQSVEVGGAELLDAESIKQSVLEVLGKRSYLFLIQEGKLRELLTRQFPIEAVSIERVYPKTLKISLKPRLPFALWQSAEESLVIDRWGIVLPQTDSPPKLELIFVDESGKTKLEPGQTLLSGETIDHLSKSRERLLRELSIDIASILLPTRESDYAKLVTTEGWQIYFALDVKNTDRQLEKLAATLRESIPDRSKLEYIDLRFSDRVFFK